MKIIIDPYRGGTDTGKEINGQYEKNILLNLSKNLSKKLNELEISTELVRNNDISLTDEERNSIINEIKDKNDIIIQNRLLGSASAMVTGVPSSKAVADAIFVA